MNTPPIGVSGDSQFRELKATPKPTLTITTESGTSQTVSVTKKAAGGPSLIARICGCFQTRKQKDISGLKAREMSMISETIVAPSSPSSKQLSPSVIKDPAIARFMKAFEGNTEKHERLAIELKNNFKNMNLKDKELLREHIKTNNLEELFKNKEVGRIIVNLYLDYIHASENLFKYLVAFEDQSSLDQFKDEIFSINNQDIDYDSDTKIWSVGARSINQENITSSNTRTGLLGEFLIGFDSFIGNCLSHILKN